jgi:hypothetical protein
VNGRRHLDRINVIVHPFPRDRSSAPSVTQACVGGVRRRCGVRRSQANSNPFKKPSESFNRAVKAFRTLQKPFRKFPFISRNRDLSMGWQASGPKKIHRGLTDVACSRRLVRRSFFRVGSSGFFGASEGLAPFHDRGRLDLAEKDRPIDPTSGKNTPASASPIRLEPGQADGRQPFMPLRISHDPCL